ncbi:MAG: glycoside hydrolase family 27 protein [Fimbriimonadia bacterium]
MIAPTPPMGWNSWNTFGGDISEELVKETVQAIIEHGFAEAGYRYVNLDDLWQAPERGPDDRLVPDPHKFPNGIKALADYVHSKGLKFGIYSCVGTHTCARVPGSFAHEEMDAQTFADWGVDFLKHDYCYLPEGVSGPMLYRRMGQALRATGRPILFSICNWGREEPWTWAASTGAQMWRTGPDIVDTWESICDMGFRQAGLEAYAGPDHWNDPDMMVVGMYGKGNAAVGQVPTDTEYRTHFSLWCLMAAPLLMGCDVRNLNPAAREILLNREVIAVDQDPLGRQGYRVGNSWLVGEVWAKPLADGSVAVGLFNRHDTERQLVGVAWESLGIHDRRPCVVRDLWAQQYVGEFRGSYSQYVEPHGCGLVRLHPA